MLLNKKMKVLTGVVCVLGLFVSSVQGKEDCDPHIETTQKTLLVRQGDGFNLSCSSPFCTHSPFLLYWCKEEQSLAQSDGHSLHSSNDTHTATLRVRSATERHSGHYLCQARKQQAQTSSAMGNIVHVLVTDFKVNVSDYDVEVSEGDSVSVNCSATFHADVKQEVSLYWSKERCNESGSAIGNQTLGEGQSQSSLELSPITVEDAGDYYCCASLATESPSEESRRIRVQVTGMRSGGEIILLSLVLAKAAVFFVIFVHLSICLNCTKAC
ncbi:hypothetical protein AOXY_G24533 [Acipenser oxyrinchus oxyrinchus]|uniref:Ig-like domain-containing protein n=1 Tax=Acipenser oxyrinchus oxyrinchus TaxID=40147 RepID=A0AAD8FX21_ACIOX|nr:hypothetical protein AOXY_G24533 [Acipenser oxyrinchus oxyrinchus]